jgi:hypothetical protein
VDDEQQGGSMGASGPSKGDPVWPPSFPHTIIDALLARLEDATTLDAEAATELLLLISDEAQRLRSTVTRLSSARLARAEQEAQAIVADAHEWATGVRAAALAIVDARLDEADRLMAAARWAARTERRGGDAD